MPRGFFFRNIWGAPRAGHIALVSGGEIYSLVTNQEYKYAFDGNQGIVAGAPLGGIVEKDPGTRIRRSRPGAHSSLAAMVARR